MKLFSCMAFLSIRKLDKAAKPSVNVPTIRALKGQFFNSIVYCIYTDHCDLDSQL